MYKMYIKQSWALIRQEKLFSGVYIVGTGLAISMVMVLSIVFYLKIAPIYPETNRDRMLIASTGALKQAKGGKMSSFISRNTALACFGDLKGLEAMTLLYNEWGAEFFVQPPGGKEQFEVVAKLTDTGFWRVFPYRFLEGKPFTEADVSSGLPVAVVSRSLARRLFGDDEAVGRAVSLNFRQYRVAGVVEDGSSVAGLSFAQIWIPYPAFPGYTEGSWDKTGTLGKFSAVLLAAPGTPLDAMRAEAQTNIDRLSQTRTPDTFTMSGQPDKQWQSVLRRSADATPDYLRELALYGGIFLIFLLVPAVSLSGMADSRMERRVGEMGIRRAFGAPARTLMEQVVTENLLFTLLGGLFGLAMSYLLVYLSRGWIMDVAQKSGFGAVLPEEVDMTFSPGMFMNFGVFGIALGVCLVLNLLSSLIPAWRAARRQILDSLNAR